MEKHYLNLSEITNIKTLWHAAWLFSDKKNTEIILQVDNESYFSNPIILKALFIILSEGILNSNTTDAKKKHEINYDQINISDYYNLATELTKLTGFNFSIALIK